MSFILGSQRRWRILGFHPSLRPSIRISFLTERRYRSGSLMNSDIVPRICANNARYHEAENFHDRPISACFTELRNFFMKACFRLPGLGDDVTALNLKDFSYWSVIQWYNTHIMKQIPIENSCNRSICAGKGQPCSSPWDIALGITHKEDLFGI